MREVIGIFSSQDTRDELGIGGVRDAFSGLLFPGTSTIQTRARYFLLVPWVYRRLEREKVGSAHAAARARAWEVELIGSLLRGGDTDGVIGKEAGRNLLRLPSVIYWGGLGDYRIRLFSSSIGDYYRSLDGYQRQVRRSLRAESEELYERGIPNWDPRLPDPPEDLFGQTTIGLAKREAAYLLERITTAQPGSMLALVARGERLRGEIPFPWDYPNHLSSDVTTILGHARIFSEVLHGAALLYNLLLARKGHADEMGERYSHRIDEYRSLLDQWAGDMVSAAGRLAAWDREQFWRIVEAENPRLGPLTRRFVDAWFTLAIRDPFAVVTDPGADQLIRSREHQLKKGLARLGNPRQLEMWNGAAGTGRLDFRWRITRTLVRDIQKGLSGAGT